MDRSVQRKHVIKKQYLFGKKFTLLDKLLLISVANPVTRNQIMSSAEIAEDLLIQFQTPLIFANHESKFVLKIKWMINEIRIKSLCQLIFRIVIQFFRRESSSQIISECDLSFILFYFFTSKEKISPWWKMQFPILAAVFWQFAQLFKFSGWN